MEQNATYMSPTLNDIQLPSDGIPIEQPKEILPAGTVASPVIVDKDLGYMDKEANTSTGNGGDQTFNGIYWFGTHIKIDGNEGRIIMCEIGRAHV